MLHVHLPPGREAGQVGGSTTRSGMPKRWMGTRSWSWQQWTQYRQTPSRCQAQSCRPVVTAKSYGGSIRDRPSEVASGRCVRPPEPHGSKETTQRSGSSVTSTSPMRSGPLRCPRSEATASASSTGTESAQGLAEGA
jgi:hypothetical protein